MKLLQLSFYNSQLSIRGQLSLIDSSTWKAANGKFMVNEKWQMVNSSKGAA